ncbi:twin-arginine translocase subunit TatC [Paludibacterium yongneupense]|uniref:twin-arginine translocase subunit TatC n=1 Tax=Paludibacterium yongneupense TaxID=400061 RepID=UPI00041980B5|nr:twin-arginine translocase subunit TatC [Paludibacterium yongneupense]
MTEELPLLAHLIELRQRLVRALAGFFIVFLALFHWSGDIYHLLARPLLQHLPAGSTMIAIEVTAPFFVPVKVTMLVAMLLSLPNTLYQLWAFIAPGLYAHEKKLVLPLLLSSLLLFFTGMAFAYFLVFPVVFGFMAAVTPHGVAMMTDIDKYLSFVLGMFVSFGVTFEVPVLVVVLARMGVVDIPQLKRARPYIIVAAFVVAAMITPPDMLSQLMLALPLCLLYEAGIWAALFMAWRKRKHAATS